MATTYNDIIKLRAGKAAFSIEEEKENEWKSFIPNEQFNKVLKTVLCSVKGNDIDSHKSFWINGTYGTGKSHAVAVITHLLCDEVNQIKDWVDIEYQEERFKSVRDSIYTLRSEKRLLPVKIEGLCNMTHVPDLALVIQTAVTKALNDRDTEIVVDTDFDTLISHIQTHEVIWNDLINRNADLSAIVPNCKNLIQNLSRKDLSTFQKAKTAMRAERMNIIYEKETLGSWLIEVQEKLRKCGDYVGLLIIWDEFTDVMNDSIGISVLKELQTIAQKFANKENDSFLFLISHPSAFNNLGVEDTKQTDGRYHRMKYNMEPVSAFKIMSRKFEKVDVDLHTKMYSDFYEINYRLLDLYTAQSNNQVETKNDLYNLYPLHPGTVNLATHYATVVGSSSRSVFEFLGQNEAICDFLSNENSFLNSEVVTADYLWDFVYKVFQDDVTNYGAVTERFNTYKLRVEHQGRAALAIFKGILLLNALNNIAGENNNNLVTPTEDNIWNLFLGTQYENEIDDVLKWFNEQGVIQRDPSGIFSVRFSALPPNEIEDIKKELELNNYHYASQILNFGDTARSFFEKKNIQKNIRPCVFDFYSECVNDSVLKNNIKSAKKKARTSDLYLCLLYSKNNTELAHLRQFAEICSESSQKEEFELKDIIFIVIDTPLGDKNYKRFIEYMAHSTSALNHGLSDQAEVHRNHAMEMIKEWMQNAQRGNATIYVNGKTEPIPISRLSSTLNRTVSPSIFPKGPDAIEIEKFYTTSTFWKPQVSKSIISTFILAKSKTELTNVTGSMQPIQWLIQDVIDEKLEWKSGSENHPLKAVYDFVQSKIKNANKSELFNFADKFGDLRKPPYGLSANFASEAMIAFALRGWVDKIFDQLGKPRDKNNLIDDIVELFKVWNEGKASTKLNFKFQTPEEGKLYKALVRLFKLDSLQGYKDITSLKDARFALVNEYIQKSKKYPLWSLKFISEEFIKEYPIIINEDIKRLIDDIFLISQEKDIKNPALIKGTIDLIDNYRQDFQNILRINDLFKNSFENFLLTKSNIELQKEEIEDAYNYIKQHLQSCIGYWTEKEVIESLKDWYINKTQQKNISVNSGGKSIIDENARLRDENARLREIADVGIGNPNSIPRKKMQAREYIDNIKNNEKLLRDILDNLINIGSEKVLDTILNTKN